jgi:DNA-directed RNA polymerase specialized sigma24 family protein
MKLTAEELTAFLDARKDRIAAIVAPADVEVALADIQGRIGERLADVGDRPSLESLVKVEATDFALRPWYTRFCCDPPDGEAFRQLFEWHEAYVKTEIRKTIRLHLASRGTEHVESVMADVMNALWENRRTFNRKKGAYVPWARGIAMNKARSYRSFNRREVSIDTDRDRPEEFPSGGPSPEDASDERLGDVQGPPAECFAEILRMVQEFEPHETIAFLCNRYLDIKPALIARSLGGSSLNEALAEVVRLVRARYPDITGIEALLAPIASRISGLTEMFGQYADAGRELEKEIGRWAERVHRSVSGTILQMGKRFLKLVCDLAAAAHEIICFLWIRFLLSPPVALLNVADRELMDLVEIFHRSYPPISGLSRSQVESCTLGLRGKISPGRSLNDFGGSDLYAAIKRWCNHVESLLWQSASSEHMLGYAYITGSLTRGKSK